MCYFIPLWARYQVKNVRTPLGVRSVKKEATKRMGRVSEKDWTKRKRRDI